MPCVEQLLLATYNGDSLSDSSGGGDSGGDCDSRIGSEGDGDADSTSNRDSSSHSGGAGSV